ncbi:MAG TPA: DUF2267 domain-containing protein [Acidimicrobiales bacterium]|nr:DUF2267 domain-containing protein [Acidimicrobiales bacterium]
MNFDEMVKAIQLAGDFADRSDARIAAEAVLSVLGERLAGREPAHLAAQLPPELALALPVQGAGERFGIEEFDRRVREREGRHLTLAEAHSHSVAVLRTITAAISTGERDDLAAQLPRTFEDLLA